MEQTEESKVLVEQEAEGAPEGYCDDVAIVAEDVVEGDE